MKTTEEVVYLVDDDASIRDSITRMLVLAGYRVVSFATAREFLAINGDLPPACLILDLQLPESNGLQLQKQLSERPRPLPIVFITGYGDIASSVQAMKAGAVDFLPKPFAKEALLSAVETALDQSRRERAVKLELTETHDRLATLTPRESEVLLYLAAGNSNKQVAGDLEIAETTVKVHRARIMKKLNVHSTAELVRLALKAGMPLPCASR